MHIELTYTLTVDDLRDFLRAFPRIVKALPPLKAQTSKSSGYRSMVGWIMILATAILLFVVFHKDPARTPTAPVPPKSPADLYWTIFVNLLPYLLIGLFLWFFFVRARFSKSAAQRAFEEDPHLAQPQHVLLSDESLTRQSPTATFIMRWTHYMHFAETEKNFVLLISRQASDLLPKRLFATPADLDEFRAFAQAHIGNQPTGFPILPVKPPQPDGGLAT